MKYPLQLIINSDSYEILVEAHRSLLDVIREEIGLTGTKQGCEDGRCGSCSILLNGQLIKSCTCLALQARGGSITTIEGLGDAEHLHPVQEAFLECGAVQCGYCTPAMILAARDLLDHNPTPTEEDIRSALQGILCRCGTYAHVVRAVTSLARTS